MRARSGRTPRRAAGAGDGADTPERRPGRPSRARPGRRPPGAGVLAAVAGVLVGLGPAAPAGSQDSAPSRPPLLAPAPPGVSPSPDGVRAALAALLSEPALRDAPVSVRDIASGAVLLEARADVGVLPASTAKIATAVAALAALPPDLRLQTRVRAGSRPGDVVLVGGGDVTLAGPLALGGLPRTARLAELAAQTRRSLGPARLRRVLVDDTAYAGAGLPPGWTTAYVTSGNAMPVSALSVDAGRTVRDRPVAGRATPLRGPRVADPALQAGRALARALGSASVPVQRGRAPEGAAELGAVASPPLPVLVELVLTRSDNDLAESLARQVALARGRGGTAAGAERAVGEVLGEVLSQAPAPPGSAAAASRASGLRLRDGSGLSRDDRLAPDVLTRLLAAAAASERLAPVLSGLPVAGFDGTLAHRFRSGPQRRAAGLVRGKTGTLRDVSALAGLVRTADGRLLAFAVVARVPAGGTQRAEAALDRVAAALQACGCR